MKKAEKEKAELNLQPQETAELERNYKDSVFVTIFHEKEKLIELYNAIFDTNYGMDTAIDIVTIKDVLFRTLKNDVSFVLDKRFVVLVEHQSTINGNLPLRDLLYIATVLKRMIDTKQLYREKTLRIPRPFLYRLVQRIGGHPCVSGTAPVRCLSRRKERGGRRCFTTHRQGV